MRAVIISLILLSGCAAADAVQTDVPDMTLVTIDGAAFPARATIAFGPGEAVGGSGPCNRWSAALLTPLPDFRTDGIMSTEMGCDDLAAEGVFFAALGAMTRAEVTAEAVVLTGPGGRSMVFRARD